MRKHYYLILLFILPLFANAQLKVRMTSEKGVYTVPCSVNGLKLKFVFDTGASNVCISISEALFMLKNGYLNESDINGSTYSQIANGEIVKNTTIKLREIEIAGIKLFDVNANVIHELSAPLLLGQSAIKKLGRIQISGNELILMDVSVNSTKLNNITDPKTAIDFYNNANADYINKNYSSAIENYTNALEINPKFAEAYYWRGSAKRNTFQDNNGAIADFTKAIEINPKFSDAYYSRGFVKCHNFPKNDYAGALLDYNKAIEIDTKNANYYFSRGELKN